MIRAPGTRVLSGGIRRVTGVLPPRLGRSEAPDLTSLYDFQPEGVRFLRARKNALLADDMGCGKSIQAIRALPSRARAIVVCPASLCANWKRAIERRRDDGSGPHGRSDLRVVLTRELYRPTENEVLIISYDALPDPVGGGGKVVLEPMGDVVLILDECQNAMNEDALRTKRVRLLARQCGVVWGLSGTPMRGTPENLWGVLVSLGLAHMAFSEAEIDGESLQGRNLFIRLCEGRPRWLTIGGVRQRRGYEWGTISPEVRRRLEAHMLRRMKHEVLDLADVDYQELPVEMPGDLTEHLDVVKEAWDGVGPGEMPPFELLSEATRAIAKARIPAMLEQAELMADSLGQILVCSAHVEPILAVGKLKGAVTFMGTEHTPEKTRQEAVKKFESGKARILGLTGAGGVGLNLQMAQGILRVDRFWTPADNQQMVDRAHRIGQKRGLLVVDMVSEHALEQRQMDVCVRKLRHIGQAVGL